jgi:Lysozyme inhibitor LprI
MMMRVNLSYGLILALMWGPVNADPLSGVPRQYAKFTLSQADVAQMETDADKECIRRATIMHVVEPSLTRCAIAQLGDLERRVQFAYTTALVRFSGSRRQTLQRDQANWTTQYDAVCREQLGLVTGQRNRFEGLRLLRCKTNEAYRRAIWLERHN